MTAGKGGTERQDRLVSDSGMLSASLFVAEVAEDQKIRAWGYATSGLDEMLLRSRARAPRIHLRGREVAGIHRRAAYSSTGEIAGSSGHSS